VADQSRDFTSKPSTGEALNEIATQSPPLAHALSRLGQAVVERETRRRDETKQRLRNTLLLRQNRTILVRQMALHAKGLPPGPPGWPKLRLVVDNG
jgi:hypothetical protein